MFPAPRQQGVDGMTFSDDEIRSIKNSTLIIHGRDDEVIPFANSEKLFSLISNAQLHAFGRCGHWTQIEHKDDFNALVSRFLA
jgi:2-hydroxymuconate-semialdehyde hydrolase